MAILAGRFESEGKTDSNSQEERNWLIAEIWLGDGIMHCSEKKR